MPTTQQPPPSKYDPAAPSEQPVPLPSAPLRNLPVDGLVLQPPLSRRGTGPGLIVFLPPEAALHAHVYGRSGHGLSLGIPHAHGNEHILDMPGDKHKPLDPEPITKWAEEGFAVVGATVQGGTQVKEALTAAVEALNSCDAVDTKDKFAVLVYDSTVLQAVVTALPSFPSIAALITHGHVPSSSPVPTVSHAPTRPQGGEESSPGLTVYSYTSTSNYFILPTAGKVYAASEAGIAHTRSLRFLREHLNGPHFDLVKIWEEHTYYEFTERSVAKTLGTMVAQPYVNHVPTMTGGIGREALTTFYRDHFIFSNPSSVALVPISRTVGHDRVVDEFIYQCQHDCVIDWLLPGVPASGNKLEIPMVAVVNMRGDRLYHEHIWWDQATALRQAGVLPDHEPLADGRSLRLPVAAYESAQMLVDNRAVTSNFMMGAEYGVQPTPQAGK